jgi:hypothetical protein
VASPPHAFSANRSSRSLPGRRLSCRVERAPTQVVDFPVIDCLRYAPCAGDRISLMKPTRPEATRRPSHKIWATRGWPRDGRDLRISAFPQVRSWLTPPCRHRHRLCVHRRSTRLETSSWLVCVRGSKPVLPSRGSLGQRLVRWGGHGAVRRPVDNGLGRAACTSQVGPKGGRAVPSFSRLFLGAHTPVRPGHP